GEARCLGGEGARARYTRVDLDDDATACARIDGELNVASTRLHAHFADDLKGFIAHLLVFTVAEREDRCDGDGVPSVHAHGVEVFDGAHHNHIVFVVAYELDLVFFPADERLLNQHFAGGRSVQAASD